MDFEEMVQRAFNVEAKAGLRSSTMVQESDACCPKSHRPSHNTFSKVQTQGSSHKDSSRTEESRPKEAKLTDGKAPAPPRSDEPTKPNHEKKKREWLKKKKDPTPSTGDNAIEAQMKKRTPGNTSQMTC